MMSINRFLQLVFITLTLLISKPYFAQAAAITNHNRISINSMTGDTVAKKLINGKVIARDDKLPVPRATIIVKGTRIGTQALDDGTFNLNVPDTSQTIIVRFLGFQDQEVNLKLTEAKPYKVILETTKAIRCGPRIPFYKRWWYSLKQIF